MSLSLQRIWSIPRRIAHNFVAANQYHSRMHYCTPITTSEDSDPQNVSSASTEETVTEDTANTPATPDYGHYISEKPDSEKGRKMRIFMPARSAGTQGVAKVGMWKVEPMNPGKRWGNPLMGWTSTRDPMNAINTGLERFETKEHAIQWCTTNGYEYEVIEPNLPRRKPKNYADTMGRRGIPDTTNVSHTGDQSG